jgi:hypothetical protein
LIILTIYLAAYGLVELRIATKDNLFSEATLAKSALEIEPDTFDGLGVSFNLVFNVNELSFKELFELFEYICTNTRIS